MKEETIERTRAVGSNKEAAITGVNRERERERERNLRLKEWNLAEDDPRTIRPTKREQRTVNRGRPLDHIGPMTIRPPLPNQNHRRISFIGREKREGIEEREEKIENREGVVRINIYIYIYIFFLQFRLQ